ncbi:hypothetical protein J6590_014261 [Homalodisca vitripennis]|nr:hypothetical protein J6590_014261 [Homalodisca vitripennis]
MSNISLYKPSSANDSAGRHRELTAFQAGYLGEISGLPRHRSDFAGPQPTYRLFSKLTVVGRNVQICGIPQFRDRFSSTTAS